MTEEQKALIERVEAERERVRQMVVRTRTSIPNEDLDALITLVKSVSSEGSRTANDLPPVTEAARAGEAPPLFDLSDRPEAEDDDGDTVLRWIQDRGVFSFTISEKHISGCLSRPQGPALGWTFSLARRPLAPVTREEVEKVARELCLAAKMRPDATSFRGPHRLKWEEYRLDAERVLTAFLSGRQEGE